MAGDGKTFVRVSYIGYKGTRYPVRDCIFIYKGRTIRRKIGCEEMERALSDGEVYADDTAEMIDGMISYYVPHALLMTLGSSELLEYIHDNIDGCIHDYFFEEE